MSKRFLTPITLTQGATLPASASVGDLFYRTDQDLTYFYHSELGWQPLGFGAPASSLETLVKNDSGGTLAKGAAVYISGADGTNLLVRAAKADAESTSSKTFGLLKQSLTSNAQGYVVENGQLTGLDTSAATVGDAVWLSPTTAGGLVYGASKPSAPNHLVYLGVVTRVSSTVGEIFVKVQNGYELDELHDVSVANVADNNLLAYDSATGTWKNQTAAEAGVSAVGHTHSIANVTSLQTSLDAKANLAGASFTGDISTTANVTVGGLLNVTAASGSEGGEIQLAAATAGNTTLNGNVKIDIYGDKLRFFESGGTNRGYYINLSNGGAAVGTSLTGGNTGAMNASYTYATKQSGVSASGTTLASVTLTTNGYPVQVLVTGDAENSTAGGWVVLQLYRGSTAIGRKVHVEASAASENIPFALTAIDVPAAGTYTYSLKTTTSVSTGTMNFGETDGPAITVIELSGPKGDAGANGQGVPTGGTANQVLAKIDSTSYNTQWTTATSANSASTLVSRDASGDFSANVITADQVITTNNGNGTNLRVGDDAWIGDFNTANAIRIKGMNDPAQGYISFGTGDAKLLGRNGTGALTFDGANVLTTATASSASTASYVVQRDANGSFAANTVTVTSLVGSSATLTASANTITPLTIKAAVSQSAVMQQWQDSTGNAVSYVNQFGHLFAAGVNSIGSSSVNQNYRAQFGTNSATAIPLAVVGYTSQSANLQQWNSVGTNEVASLAPTGTFTTVGNINISNTAKAFTIASANVLSQTALTLSGSTSGTATVQANAVAGTGTVITLPGATGTLALTSDLPTVNDATLTLAVSGTGLSGSQTFTANQAANATFTVTSNANAANGASTIVARDANGSFAANVITAGSVSAGPGTFTGALVGQSLQMTFATVAARNTAIPSPTVGMLCFISGDGQVQVNLNGTTSGWYPIAGQMPMLVVRKTANQTVTAVTNTLITFSSTGVDVARGGFVSANVASNVVTVPYSGYYNIKGVINWDTANTTGNNRFIRLYAGTSGSHTLVTSMNNWGGLTSDYLAETSAVVYLLAGQSVSMYGYGTGTTGSTFTVFGSSASAWSSATTSLSVIYLGP